MDNNVFRLPEMLNSKSQSRKPIDLLDFENNDLSSVLGRPSFQFEDGRESLGILPQFKKMGNFEFERDDSFLVGTSSEKLNDPFYNIGRPSLLYDGRPSLLYDGRESLGILPQFKNGNFITKLETHAEMEVCLLSPSSASKICLMDKNAIANTNTPKNEIDSENVCENLLTKFKLDCEAIERGEFILPCDIKDTTDDNYSVYVEANFLASKIADNSILDISQEGGTILDETPQPDFLDDDSFNKFEKDKKVDTAIVYKQLDFLLPPSTSESKPSKTNEMKTMEPGDVVKYLSAFINQVENNQIRNILDSAMNKIYEYLETEAVDEDTKDKDGEQHEFEEGSVFEDDSGHSSTENDKGGDCNVALDLSVKACSTEIARGQVLDLSFNKESIPRRLSITFSHKNDPTLPEGQTSNNLKQQSLHMRQLMGGNLSTSNVTTAPSIDGSVSILSSDSKNSVASSTGSCCTSAMTARVRLKSKKSEGDLQVLKRGPLKAIVPLNSLNTSLTMEEVGGGARSTMKQRTPVASLRPMAQSTPEDSASTHKKVTSLGSPLARPDRAKPILQRGKKLIEMNRAVPTVGVTSVQPQQAKIGTGRKMLSRGKSSTDIKPPAVLEKRQTLRRCTSVGGKENLSTQQVYKQPSTISKIQTNLSKLSQKAGMKPVNLIEKLAKK